MMQGLKALLRVPAAAFSSSSPACKHGLVAAVGTSGWLAARQQYSSTTDTITKNIKDAANTTQEAAHDFKEWTKEGAHDAAAKAKYVVDHAGEFASSAVHKAEQAAHNTAEAVHKAEDAAAHFVDDVKTGKIVQQAKDAAAHAVEYAKHVPQDVKEPLQDFSSPSVPGYSAEDAKAVEQKNKEDAAKGESSIREPGA